MPNPRNKHSKRRKRARRTHHGALMPTLSTCATTGEVHMRHNAYAVDGNLYHKGRMIVQGVATEAATEE
jgi:large subunit ribosomal protein L32